MFKCGNCGHQPHEDDSTGPLANIDASKDPCSECGAKDWVEV